MFSSAILDVSIGLALVYLVLALVCTAVTEAINQRLALRASNLKLALGRLLDDPDTVARFYSHPLMRGLRESDASWPSYLPADLFRRVLLDMAGGAAGPPITAEALRDALTSVNGLLAAQPRASLLALLDADEPTLDDFHARLDAWFNQAMERSSGWYRRRVAKYTRAAAAGIVLALNADTVQIARATWDDAGMRRELVAQAEVVIQEGLDGPGQVKKQAEALQSRLTSLDDLAAPIGWDREAVEALLPFLAEQRPEGDTRLKTLVAWLSKIAGLAATALAVSLGAPFWFDALKQVGVVRSEVGASLPSPSERAPSA